MLPPRQWRRGLIQAHHDGMQSHQEIQHVPESAFLTVPETASLLGISRNSTYELVRRNRLPHVRLGRTVRIPRRIFERWIESEVGIPLPDPAVVSWSREPIEPEPSSPSRSRL